MKQIWSWNMTPPLAGRMQAGDWDMKAVVPFLARLQSVGQSVNQSSG